MQKFPDIPQLEDMLFNLDAAMGATESHGALCGMLCAQGATNAAQWMLHVLGEHEKSSPGLQAVGKELMKVHQISVEQMNNNEINFELMLPDDDDQLEDRVEGLGIWCQGFVYGLAAGGLSDDTKLPGDTQEILMDFVEISRAGHSTGDDDVIEVVDTNEEDELAFVEVVEYVRTGVLLINEELQSMVPSPTLH